MCQRDWPLEGTPIGPFLPTLDSVKSVGNSEKQHILGAHLLSTLRETHRQPSPARMEDSQGALQSLRRMRDSMLCSLHPPTPLPYTHLPTPTREGEEKPLGSCSSPACYLRTCVCFPSSRNICTELCRAPLKFLALALP